ncbi:protein GVQW3-like [Uloborus diversus]|uniref:protein GVQW3-like n=1 Tax=Uloborus diversus TaxID=327109 RepID=UPI00240967EA|nr:protein GVQW3-like [Uloborus diversus]
MDGNLEQRYAIKFCVRLNKTASETLVMIQDAFKEEAMSRAAVFHWHKRFKDGRQNVEDDDRSGRPSTSRTDNNVDRVRQLLKSDRRLSIRLIGDKLGLDHMTVFRIVTENLNMRKVCAKLVPKILTDEQNRQRVTACEEMLQRLNNDPNCLDKVITGDESWF